MVLGAPGGPRIITAVLQVLLNVIDFRMNIQDAVDAPRFHHQWKPDKLYLEPGISPDTVALLEGMGHQVDYSPGIVLARVNRDSERRRLARRARPIRAGSARLRDTRTLPPCNAPSRRIFWSTIV